MLNQNNKTGFLKQFTNGIINFVLPPVCVCCDNPLELNMRFVCGNCFSKFKKVDENHNIWGDRVHKVNFDGNALSLYWFVEDTEIQHILHAFKYSKMKSIGKVFGKILGDEIIRRYPASYDYAVPVPLHKAKLRERTYNQSNYICRGISESLNIQPLEK